MNLILDTLGLPPCDDVHEARRKVREVIQNDREVEAKINEIIRLSANIAYGIEDKEDE